MIAPSSSRRITGTWSVSGSADMMTPAACTPVWRTSPSRPRATSITFATAVGSFGAKFVSEPIIERLGFRITLLIATFITVLGVFIMGLYTPQTPLALMLPLLVITGFFQSIFWTATNAFTFADIDDKDAGQATAISQVTIQLSLAFGVALGGGTLELVRRTHGGDPALMDFHIAFYVIAAVAVVSTVMFFFLPKNAGAHLTGHGHGAVAVEAAE